MQQLTPEQQHIIENDEHHILDMKIHIAKKQRLVNGAAMIGWFGLVLLSLAWELQIAAVLNGLVAVVYLFRCNIAWKNLIDLKEVHDERYSK